MSQRNIQAIYRLSPMQEGILYHTLEAARPGVYFEQYHCEFAATLDRDRLQAAWCGAVERHAVLRTLFTWEARDKPLQIVRQSVELPWRDIDWRELDANEQRLRWDALVARDRDTGFRLDQAPLTRITLVRLADTRWRMLWSFHHLLIDGWSMRLILNEVLSEYDAAGLLQGQVAARGYGDFIGWLEQQDMDGAKQFFRQQLAGYRNAARLTPQPGTSSASGMCSRQLDAATSAALTTIARAHRLTLNALVLGAWSLVLAGQTRADDLVIGTTVSGRPTTLDGAESIAGLFINTLPLRVGIDPASTLADWLGDLQRRQIAMTAFHYAPLAAVQRLSGLPPGDALFETIVVFENFPPVPARHERALLPQNERYIEYSNYPLAILAVPGEQMTLIGVHDANRFGASFVAALLDQLTAVLTQMSRSLEQSVGEISLCSEPMREQVVGRFSREGVASENSGLIHDLIAAAASRDPDAVAATDSGGQISRRELDAAANRLASYLAGAGIGPGVCVPVFVERSTAAIIAIVAILKAGGAYLAVDASLPAQRVADILDDLVKGPQNVPIVITTTALQARLGGFSGQRFCIDACLAGLEDNDPPDSGVIPDDAAYVIYTSGSTGKPKGVIVRHRNLVHSTLARNSVYADTPDHFLLLSSLSTDSAVAGLFWALTCGASLVLPPRRMEQDVDALSMLIREHHVSHTLCVPSLYDLLLENAPASRLASLRTVIVAGEACRASTVAAHRATLPGCALYNEYGPSEAAVWASVARLHPAVDDIVTIGRPIPGATLYVVDNYLAPLPVGVAGEILIGGAGVTAGYLYRPNLTAERFVADPFDDDADARVYRTGDLGRWRADGRLEFLGRIDNQVKIRGYRVELEEVEAVLALHPDIAEVAVALDTGAAATDMQDDPQALADALAALDAAEADSLLDEIEATGAIDSWLGNADSAHPKREAG